MSTQLKSGSYEKNVDIVLDSFSVFHRSPPKKKTKEKVSYVRFDISDGDKSNV